MRGDGRVFQRRAKFWIAYYRSGQEFREPGGRTEKEAHRKLKERLSQIQAAAFVGPKQERITVNELLDNLEVHLETKGAKAMASLHSHLKPVREAFAFDRAVSLSADRLEHYVQDRLAAGKAKATVNREVGALRQSFYLARKQKRLSQVPYFPMLREDNARSGFFEKAEFEAVVANLPEVVADVARFAYLSGWRKGEIVNLTWDAVDRAGREVKLRTSKNGRPRTLPLTGSLLELVERRWEAREYRTPDGLQAISEYVFHRDGRQFGEFKKSWATACRKSGIPGKLFHDLRRTAVRNMIRAGVPQSVAMRISGHRTTAIFLRYDITSEDDKRHALRLVEEHLGAQPTTRNVISMPSR